MKWNELQTIEVQGLELRLKRWRRRSPRSERNGFGSLRKQMEIIIARQIAGRLQPDELQQTVGAQFDLIFPRTNSPGGGFNRRGSQWRRFLLLNEMERLADHLLLFAEPGRRDKVVLRR